MKPHYLEIVTPELDATCALYQASCGTSFSDPEPLLGNARVAQLDDGSLLGIRAPMHDSEAPIVRPYWLVQDIQAAVTRAVEAGAQLAHEPLEIPGKGTFAIVIQGGNHVGFWML